MRVVHVNQDPGISPTKKKGAAVHLEAMRRAFEQLGAEVIAIDESRAEGVRAGLQAAAQAGPLDLVYERYTIGSGAAFDFARATGTRYVLEVNSPLEEEADRYRKGGRPGRELDAGSPRDMFAGADTVLAVSSEVAEYARGRGATDENLRIQPNGVDAERFQPRSEDDPLRAGLIPEGAFVLGFHGRVRPWHNFPMLVSAVARLIEEGLPMHLMMVGQGEYRELVGDLLDEDVFTIVPWTPHEEIGRFVACFDALVMTHSARAPFYFSPLKLYEAMAAGAVPIVPSLGDLARILEHEQTALLFPADDQGALLAAIRRLHSDSALHRRIAAAAMSEARKHSWVEIAQSVLGGGEA